MNYRTAIPILLVPLAALIAVSAGCSASYTSAEKAYLNDVHNDAAGNGTGALWPGGWNWGMSDSDLVARGHQVCTDNGNPADPDSLNRSSAEIDNLTAWFAQKDGGPSGPRTLNALKAVSLDSSAGADLCPAPPS